MSDDAPGHRPPELRLVGGPHDGRVLPDRWPNAARLALPRRAPDGDGRGDDATLRTDFYTRAGAAPGAMRYEGTSARGDTSTA